MSKFYSKRLFGFTLYGTPIGPANRGSEKPGHKKEALRLGHQQPGFQEEETSALSLTAKHSVDNLTT